MAALVDSPLAGQVSAVLAHETGTQAIRAQRIEQWPASRNVEEVDVDGRRVRVEVSTGRVKVEHADATLAARHIGIPVREVVSLAEEAWRRRSRAELTEVVPMPTGDDDDGRSPRRDRPQRRRHRLIADTAARSVTTRLGAVRAGDRGRGGCTVG